MEPPVDLPPELYCGKSPSAFLICRHPSSRTHPAQIAIAVPGADMHNAQLDSGVLPFGYLDGSVNFD